MAFGAGTGTLNFNHTSNNYIFTPAIGGNGSVNLLAGVTILPATNTYTGATTINGGALFVNGSIASSSLTTVNGGAVLSGSGTVGTTIVNGTIAPGNGPIIGTLNVNGTYTQNAGSTYQVKVGSQPPHKHHRQRQHQRRHGGRAGRRRRSPQDLHHRHDPGGVAGTYSGLTSNFAFVTPFLSYDPNNVFLTLKTSFAGGGGTRNEVDVGKVLDEISGSAKGDLGSVSIYSLRCT